MNTPSPGALRAAKAITALELECANASQQNIVLPTNEVAQIIDRESGLAECVEALRKAYTELNIICARDGVPYCHDGMKSDVDAEYFNSVVEECRAALAKAQNPNASVKQVFPKGRYS